MAFKMTRNKTMVGAAAAAAGIALAALTLTGSDLQTMINETPAGGVLTISGTYTGNFVITKAITIEGDAKLITPNADPVFNIPPNTRDVTLRGLTLTTTPGWTTVHDLIRIGDQGEAQDTIEEAPTNITITHCKLSAQPDQNIQRGISANGANITITNTEIREIHARGYDTQAIGVWNGPGPFYIADNYLEGSGENVMFGGAAPSIKVGGSSVPNLTITGVKFIRNRVVKPLSWRGVWSVKNLFELKNCRDCFIDGNVFDGNWTDAQAGRAIVFTPRPSDSGVGAVVEDVVFSNNIVRNTGSGVLLLGHDEAPAPTDVRLKRVKVINNVFENVNGPQFGSNGVFVTVIAGTEDVTIANNTVFQTGNIISSDYDPSTRFTYRDNIAKHNEYGIMGSGKSPGNSTIDYYFPGGTIAGNLIAQEVNAPGNVAGIYPAGNYYPATLNAVGFVDLAGGNYRLAASSAYKGKGTGGADPGCDIDLLNAALGGSGTTPTPLPTASMSPSATPSASPQPSGVPSADGTKGPTVVDSQLAVWTLGPQPELRTLRNGAQAGGGQGKEYKYLSKVVYVAGLDSQWYRWTGSGWTWHSVTEPGGATPTPTPVPSPTSQPLPSPSPSATPTPRPSPSPTPSLPVCTPNQLIGNPARCLCMTGARCTGGNARCL